jgi:8-oxo-dGTP pyrophosphatase MutT (NUDIX family)
VGQETKTIPQTLSVFKLTQLTINLFTIENLLKSTSLDFYLFSFTIVHMAKELVLHKIQSEILVSLLLASGKRFSELNKNKEVESDQFNFHLKQLISNGLVTKDKASNYILTTAGKEFANRFDTDTKLIERQAKIGVLICCTIQKDGKTMYLLQQRLKQPYYGFWGFITGKVRWGESIFKTAKRELYEETGLRAKFKLTGVKHKTDFDVNGTLLEDKFFFVIKAEKPTGKFKEEFEGGRNKWFPEKEISKIDGLFEDVGVTLKMANQKKFKFSEMEFKVKRY